MTFFDWNSLSSLVKFDTKWVYRELFIIPVLVVVLAVAWMKLVGKAFADPEDDTKTTITLEEAALDAAVNEDYDTDEREAEEEEERAEAKKSK